jgi:hypothetical protein
MLAQGPWWPPLFGFEEIVGSRRKPPDDSKESPIRDATLQREIGEDSCIKLGSHFRKAWNFEEDYVRYEQGHADVQAGKSSMSIPGVKSQL